MDKVELWKATKQEYDDFISLLSKLYDSVLCNLDEFRGEKEAILINADTYIQALLMKITLEDKYFSELEALIISGITQHGDLFREYDLMNFVGKDTSEYKNLKLKADTRLEKLPLFLKPAIIWDSASKSGITQSLVNKILKICIYFIQLEYKEVQTAYDCINLGLKPIITAVTEIKEVAAEYGVSIDI